MRHYTIVQNLLIASCVSFCVSGFVPLQYSQWTQPQQTHLRSFMIPQRLEEPSFREKLLTCSETNGENYFSIMSRTTISIASTITTMILLPNSALATTEVELADLPPPWIPVVFGLGLVVGVGLLTGSLGDVIEQESQLGLQSGARAKKEIERSRSSYFKKK